MYGWKPDYLLDGLTFEQVMMYYKRGIEFEETKAKILISTYAQALNPDHEAKSKEVSEQESEKPDRAAFYAACGKNIKRA